MHTRQSNDRLLTYGSGMVNFGACGNSFSRLITWSIASSGESHGASGHGHHTDENELYGGGLRKTGAL